MQTKTLRRSGQLQAPVPLRVEHRRHSRLPLRVPVRRPGADRQEADRPGAELSRIQEKFKDATPQEREILRKLGFRFQQRIREALQALTPEPP